jgi:GMP synthase-like glutamine amidotransferase
MICFIDLEHDSWLRHRQNRLEHYGFIMDVKLKLEALSRQPCILQRYCDASLQGLRDLGISALVISGNATEFSEYGDCAFTELHRIIRAAEWPIIGFCGGHQQIAAAHGAEVGPMRPLHAGEPDLTDLSGPGYLKEWGFTAVNVVDDDPILDGLGRAPVFLEMHYCEAKQLPASFRLLASTPDCRVQLMRRDDRLVYGMQFHPEAYTEWPNDNRSELVNLVYPDGYAEPRLAGRTILENFFRIAGILTE